MLPIAEIDGCLCYHHSYLKADSFCVIHSFPPVYLEYFKKISHLKTVLFPVSALNSEIEDVFTESSITEKYAILNQLRNGGPIYGEIVEPPTTMFEISSLTTLTMQQ